MLFLFLQILEETKQVLSNNCREKNGMKCQLNTKLRKHSYLEDYLNLNAGKNTVLNYNNNEQVFS